MKWFDDSLSRRSFLKWGLFSLGGLALRPWSIWSQLASSWSDAERLGRICVGMASVRSRPSISAPLIGDLYEDTVIVWLREVVGETPEGRQNARWIETPDGFIYAPSVQPVANHPNIPVSELPQSSLGKGMWVEVTVPHTQLFLENQTPSSPWLQDALKFNMIPKMYYSQVIWVDDIRTNAEGQVLYRLNERYGYGDVFWSAAESFRPLTTEELEPINPEVEEKKVVVDVNSKRQLLSCYEGNQEVYNCQISSGAVWNAAGEIVQAWATPLGRHFIWRKAVSIHMSGGQTGAGYDLPGVAWTTLFMGEGVAIHSTFWHNEFGTPKSRGCINCKPEDARWIFRWTLPEIVYDPGDLTVSMPGGTIIDVVET